MVQLSMKISRGKGAAVAEQLKAKFPKAIDVRRAGESYKTSYKLVAFYTLDPEAKQECAKIRKTHFCLVRRRRKTGYITAVYGVYKSVLRK